MTVPTALSPDQDAIEHDAQILEVWCNGHGLWVSPDGRVHPETAAQILGVTEATLRTWRSLGTHALPFHRTGQGRGRISYALRDLARHVAARRVID